MNSFFFCQDDPGQSVKVVDIVKQGDGTRNRPPVSPRLIYPVPAVHPSAQTHTFRSFCAAAHTP